MIKRLFLVVAFSSVGFTSFATQPIKAVTPGALCTPTDPNFDGYRYKDHVAHCARRVTREMKLQVAQAYGGIPQSEWHNYEFDHLIPLNAGGASSIENLWPQPLDEAHEKDQVEQQTSDGLLNGTLTQKQAVQMIWDWINAH